MIKPKPKKRIKAPVQSVATIKPRPINAKFVARINTLLQRHRAGESILADLAPHLDAPQTEIGVISAILQTCTATITTHQHVSEAFQANLSWIDPTDKPHFGWYRRPMYSIIVSPSMSEAIIIAYLNIAKQAGQFP